MSSTLADQSGFSDDVRMVILEASLSAGGGDAECWISRRSQGSVPDTQHRTTEQVGGIR